MRSQATDATVPRGWTTIRLPKGTARSRREREGWNEQERAARAAGIRGPLFRRRRVRGAVHHFADRSGGLVLPDPEAFLDAAVVALRAGLVGALPDDGGGRLVGLAAGGLGGPARRAYAVSGSARPQRRVVRAVLRAPLAVPGGDRDRAALDRHSADRARLLPRLAARGVADGALSALGELRVGAQLHDLAAERVSQGVRSTATQDPPSQCLAVHRIVAGAVAMFRSPSQRRQLCRDIGRSTAKSLDPPQCKIRRRNVWRFTALSLAPSQCPDPHCNVRRSAAILTPLPQCGQVCCNVGRFAAK